MRVENIAGVAQSCFSYLATFTHGVDGKTHIIQAVQAIKNTEDINTVFRSQLDKLFYYVIGVAGVADGVSTA